MDQHIAFDRDTERSNVSEESGRWCIGFEGDPLMSLTLLRMFTVVHCVQSLCTLQIHNISIIYP